MTLHRAQKYLGYEGEGGCETRLQDREGETSPGSTCYPALLLHSTQLWYLTATLIRTFLKYPKEESTLREELLRFSRVWSATTQQLSIRRVVLLL